MTRHDTYSHMAVVSIDEADEAAQALPKRMTPKFSLAYLRDCTDGAMLCNAAGRISFVNDAALSLFRLASPEAAAGMEWWEIWPEEMEALLQDAHKRTLGGEAVRFTTFLGDESGEAGRYDVMTSPVVDVDGKTDAVFSIIMPAEKD